MFKIDTLNVHIIIYNYRISVITSNKNVNEARIDKQ